MSPQLWNSFTPVGRVPCREDGESVPQAFRRLSRMLLVTARGDQRSLRRPSAFASVSLEGPLVVPLAVRFLRVCSPTYRSSCRALFYSCSALFVLSWKREAQRPRFLSLTGFEGFTGHALLRALVLSADQGFEQDFGWEGWEGAS